ncbi:MAG: glycoside hydrolase family 97 N-terminal domain-containing protein [Deltaproteobacteria bacterium]|nr:glycoside hydrolase family 97 N-terminal domain-containing protein [Deltaproteobacteria bacterium]
MVTVADVLVASPSGDVRMAVATDAEGRMTYTVTRGDITVVGSSPLGLSATTHDLTTGVTMSSSSGRAIDESYTRKRNHGAVEGCQRRSGRADHESARRWSCVSLSPTRRRHVAGQ